MFQEKRSASKGKYILAVFYQKGNAASSLKIWPVAVTEVVILKVLC